MTTPMREVRSWVPWLWPATLAAAIALASGRSEVAGPDIVNIDKLAHFLVFGLLATLIARIDGVRAWPGLGLGWAVVLASTYGLLDEYHQSFTPGRFVEVADWVADTLGAAVAVALYARWPWYRRLLETRLGRRKRRIETGSETVPDRAT